ncbi:hypothetical protein HHI36_001595 [Cryptolaemus montrouzieri]|uniref:Myb-like domain-containing protein n=1 Tax=Cryptolaemus montrouzieri TaxID=559131 RepID=A0ABD2P836_9CUCU
MKCFRATVSYSKYYSLRQKIRFFTEENEEYKNILKEDINDPLEMLPSMPSLNLIETSNNVSTIQPKSEDIGEENENTKDEVKNNLQDSELLDSTGSKEFKSTIENVNKNLNSEFLEMIDADKDNVEEINAFMVASSTVKSVREKKELLSLSDKKKAKKRKEYLASIAMLTPPDPTLEKDRREQFAQAYLEKLKETLEPNDYRKVEILCEDTDEKTGNAVDLYKKLRPILSPKYKDLADEFLLFLNAEQANAVGKLIPFFILNHMVKFLRNLEIYFKDQPSQLKKIYKSLLEFNDGTNASLDKVKSTILPLLRGNPLLCDCFLQIFIEESPTATLLNGTWEIIDVNKELCRPEDEAAFESVTISDSEDSACACSCHKIDEQQPLKQHCVNCGLRFMHGKVYCQTGKGFKRVQITFPFNPDVDHIARLGVQNRTKRIEHSPSKRLNSPIKEPQDENRICNESEDDDKRKNVKACKSPKKTKPKPKKDTPAKSSRKESPKKNIEKSSNKSNPCRRKRTKSIKLNDSVNRKIINDEDKVDSEFLSKPGNSSGQIKRLVNGIDWKNLPSPEYLDIHSSDSELSQDDSTKHHLPSKECYIKDKTSCENWTREEDKIILETFQQKFDQDAIQLIAKRLKKRRVDEIRTRFERLMALLQEMETS